MNKIIGIYDGSYWEYDENSLSGALGGSESWVLYISEALAKIPNVHIFVYCNCKYHCHKDYNNIEFRPHDFFFTSNLKYDSLIISRFMSHEVIAKLKESNCCNNIYLMAHDTILRYTSNYVTLWSENVINYEDITNDDFLNKNIKKVFALSKWAKEYLNEFSHFPNEFVELTSHGCNSLQINLSNDVERDNSIFWSNNIYRNFDILVDKIAPIIIKEIPDFKIYFSHYGELDIKDDYVKNLINKEYVINLGNLSKNDLYAEMRKHKCYFYPTIFPETFCITCLEQALANVSLLIRDAYGPSTIFEPYKYLMLDENTDFNNDDHILMIANKIINEIKTYYDDNKIALRKSIRNYIINTYNWDNIAQDLYNKMNLS